MGLCFWYPRKHHILPGVPRTTANVPARVPEEVDGGVQLGAVRGGALQLHAVDPVRAGEEELQPAAHHQRLRLRRRGHLHPPLPHLRAQDREAPHAGLLLPAQRGRLLAHHRRHRHARRRAPPGEGARQHLPRLLHGRLRRPLERHICGDQDEERGVHALLAVLLPHPERRRLVLLRPLHQGHLRHDSQRGRLLLRLRPDGALLLVPEAQVGLGPADDDRHRSGPRDDGGGARAAGRRPHDGHDHGERAPGAGGAAEDGAGHRDAVAAQGLHQGLLTTAALHGGICCSAACLVDANH